MSQKRVLIVGAGPTGASLALLLARKGIPTTLIEREASLTRLFRGEGMMPSGMDALAQMGLLEEAERLPQRRLDRWEFYFEGGLVARWAEPDRNKPNAVRALSQSHLLKLLTAKCAESPSFTFLPDCSVTGLVREPSGITLLVRGRDGENRLRGDFVVGADGRASIVRKLAGLYLDRSRERARGNYDAIWCSMPLPSWLEHEMVFYGFGARDSSATMYASPTGGLRVGWMVPKGSKTDLRRCDVVEEVARRAPTFVAAFLRSRKDEASEPVYFDVLFGRCNRWCAPGVLLLGDAAHPMNPVRAQGINLGLRDALVAANHLVPVLARDDASSREVNAAAGRIRPEREEEVRVAQDAQLRAAAAPAVFGHPWFRKGVLPVLARLGVGRRMLQRMDQPLRYGVSPVRLSV